MCLIIPEQLYSTDVRERSQVLLLLLNCGSDAWVLSLEPLQCKFNLEEKEGLKSQQIILCLSKPSYEGQASFIITPCLPCLFAFESLNAGEYA